MAGDEDLEQDIFGSDSDGEADLLETVKRKAEKATKTKGKSPAKPAKGAKKRARAAEDTGDKEREAAENDSENDDEGPETDADRAFIDRSGKHEEENFGQSDDDDDAPRAPAEEAEEADEGDEGDVLATAFKSKGRKRHDVDIMQLRAEAEALVRKMDTAVVKDNEDVHRKRPGVKKLLMLKEVVDAFNNRDMSELLFEEGALSTIYKWLEPSVLNMVLPNLKLRSELFRVLRDVKLEAEREDIREMLKKSRLGGMIMFYSKCPDEEVENRRICTQLCNRWSEAIFNKHTRHGADTDADTEAAAARGRLRAKSGEEQKRELPGSDLKRFHAFVPQPVPLDFVAKPEGGIRAGHVPKSESNIAKQKRLKKRLDGIAKNNMKQSDRAEQVSVEGRGLPALGHGAL